MCNPTVSTGIQSPLTVSTKGPVPENIYQHIVIRSSVTCINLPTNIITKYFFIRNNPDVSFIR